MVITRITRTKTTSIEYAHLLNVSVPTGREATTVSKNAVKTNNVGVGRGIMYDIDQVVRLNLNG